MLAIDPQFPWALLPVGRVIRVHQSANGHVRPSDIHVKDKVYIQPVAQLITLPMIPETEENERGPPASMDQCEPFPEANCTQFGGGCAKIDLGN